jgi:hypothetical protein
VSRSFVGTHMMTGQGAAAARPLAMDIGAKVPAAGAYRLLAAGVRAANCGGEEKVGAAPGLTISSHIGGHGAARRERKG